MVGERVGRLGWRVGFSVDGDDIMPVLNTTWNVPPNEHCSRSKKHSRLAVEELPCVGQF